MKGFKFEESFTQQEYDAFVKAVAERRAYKFQLGNYKDKIQVIIDGQICEDKVWQPDNYFWSIYIQDNRNGYNGLGQPFHISELKSYEEIIDYVYAVFKIERSAA